MAKREKKGTQKSGRFTERESLISSTPSRYKSDRTRWSIQRVQSKEITLRSGSDILAGNIDEYLGGKGTLLTGSSLRSEFDYIRLIRKGIRRTSIDHLIAVTRITPSEMAAILQIPDEDFRKLDPEEKLEQDQTEKAIRIAKLYLLGKEVFGSLEEFINWMNGKVPSLGNKKPKDYLDTISGINLLIDEIIRIQHGVYS